MITFRPLEKSDLDDRVRWFNQKEVAKFLGTTVRNGTTYEKQLEWFDRYISHDDRKIFVIELDGKPVGNVGLVDINTVDNNAGIFIVIGDPNQFGKGIGKEAMNFILDYGFSELKLHKIWLYVNAINERAINLYKNCGFEEEGRLKEMIFDNDQYFDELVMAKFNPEDTK